jgi:serine/threonine protein kinase
MGPKSIIEENSDGVKKRTKSQMKRSVSATTQPSTSREDSASTLQQLSEDLARKLVIRTEERVSQVLSKSALRKQSRLREIETFTLEDLTVGDFIASGGFSDVFAIRSFNKKTELTSEAKKGRQYVLKHLNPGLVADRRKLAVGAKDLALEAHFLSSLDHKHIIGLRGWPKAGLASFIESGRIEGFFLILDRLNETLTNRIGAWHREAKEQRANGSIPSSTRRKFFAQRLKTAIQVASALEYIHEHRIVFRDLKP